MRSAAGHGAALCRAPGGWRPPGLQTEAAGPACAAPPGITNTPLLTLRLAGEALLRASHGSGQSQTFSSPSAEIPPQLPGCSLRFTG